jgi:hypothetical protein
MRYRRGGGSPLCRTQRHIQQCQSPKPPGRIFLIYTTPSFSSAVDENGLSQSISIIEIEIWTRGIDFLDGIYLWWFQMNEATAETVAYMAIYHVSCF